MANKTDASAIQIHGTNPQMLIEKITRQKIHGDAYWKEHCFALTAETIVDRAMELDHIGGTYGGNKKPAPFIQLVLKLLQIQPEKEIIVEFIKNEDFKYVRALGAFYMRLVGKPIDVYQYLEPLLNDYRKLREVTGGENASHAKRDLKKPERMAWAGYTILYMDDFIDKLLREDMVLDIALPTLPKRINLEDTAVLQPRISPLDDDLQDDDEDDEDTTKPPALPPPTSSPPRDSRSKRPRSVSPARRPRSPRSPDRPPRDPRDRSPPRRERSRSRDRRSRSRSRDRRRSRSRDRYRDAALRRRSRSRSRDRHRRSRSRSRSRSRDRRKPRRSRSASPRSPSDSRSRSRSRSRDRKRKSRSASRDRKDKDKKDRRRSPSRSPPRKKDKKKEDKEAAPSKGKAKLSEVDTEIAEANALRESLGLKPLQKVDDWKGKKR